ncbi:MAG TPA: hypothetical protein VGV38_19390, partial [Pyrinomonadaceae bacterium]|nr:hypothetical protein [Pyrinomonadaceae bacterium]
MNRRAKKFMALAGVLLLGGASVWLAAATLLRGSFRAGQRLDYRAWEELVDAKAGRAAGGDERAVRELVDAAFLSPQLYGVPAILANPFKERLVRSEVKYRRGAFAGVTAETLARVFDELATRFAAPDYARTDASEINSIRLSLSYSMPRLVPRRPAGEAKAPAPYFMREAEFAVPEMMSPVEASLVALALIQQKEINEFYLLTRAEREQLAISLDKLDATHELTREERFDVARALAMQTANPSAPRRTPEELAALAKKATEERAGAVLGARLEARVMSPRAKEMQAVMGRG